MKIEVKRTDFTDKSTIGDMIIDDNFFCHTLEDVVRESGVKVAGKTAIPSGTYEVIIDMSNRFKKLMPHILNVPMFEGIRIHPGNTDKDTEGCLLVGFMKSKDFVGQSKAAYEKFMPKLEEGLKEGKVFIIIG